MYDKYKWEFDPDALDPSLYPKGKNEKTLSRNKN
jgi:hypothetical protein